MPDAVILDLILISALIGYACGLRMARKEGIKCAQAMQYLRKSGLIYLEALATIGRGANNSISPEILAREAIADAALLGRKYLAQTKTSKGATCLSKT